MPVLSLNIGILITPSELISGADASSINILTLFLAVARSPENRSGLASDSTFNSSNLSSPYSENIWLKFSFFCLTNLV